MKIYISVFVLVMLLVAASGCTTQQAKPAATTLTTTVVTTEVPTAVNTPLPTTVPTVVSTTVASEVSTTVTTVATPQPTMTASTKITVIHIMNNTFVPAELTVLPGTGITWINDDSVTHIVKATGDAKGKFTSTDIIKGAQFGYTFGEEPGTYEFMDPNYPSMKGAIIIKKGQTLWSMSNLT